jgi:DNA-directed RNA polymerase subunit RPC12/RpoP
MTMRREVTIRAQDVEVAKWWARKGSHIDYLKITPGLACVMCGAGMVRTRNEHCPTCGERVPYGPAQAPGGSYTCAHCHETFELWSVPTIDEESYAEFKVLAPLLPPGRLMDRVTLITEALKRADVALDGLLSRCDNLEVRVETR